MKIVMIDDYEWWVGESVEACVAAAAKEHGNDPHDETYEDAHELDDAALDGLRYVDTDENEQPIGDSRSFREQLAIEISDGGDFPRLFACTEY